MVSLLRCRYIGLALAMTSSLAIGKAHAFRLPSLQTLIELTRTCD